MIDIRRHCYDKPHRCPGWAGGGWKFPKPHRDICESGSLPIQYERRFESLRVHQCPRCGVYALPIAIKWIDPTWLKYWIRYKIEEMNDK